MAQQIASPHVLVYTATAGYRHDSIPTAISVLGQLGPTRNVTFTFSEDQGMFTDSTLATFDGVLFVSVSRGISCKQNEVQIEAWRTDSIVVKRELDFTEQRCHDLE